MKTSKSYLSILVVMLLLVGCGNSIPMGSDSNVEDLVIGMVGDKVRRDIGIECYSSVTGEYDVYTIVRALKRNNSPFQDEIDECIDGVFDTVDIDIKNIRTDKVYEDAKKSFSSATITIDGYYNKNGGSIREKQIQYTAQLNSDGEVYVKATGI